MKVSSLWKAPELNPANGKALSIPMLNPVDIYGRNFHLAWLGFFVAFLSWFAFPPLMEEIREDLHMTATDVSNSNIVGLCATLLARFSLGPLCDRYGPRITMAITLIIGAVPTAFVPLVTNKQGVYAIRFFIGLLGGTFVPCQYWCTTFFDKSIVGRANALAGGWGNAGGGVAFFSMPAVMHSLLKRGYSRDHAWKYSFLVLPLIVIMVVAISCLLFGEDCPEGRWSERTTTTELLRGEGNDDDEISSDIDKEKNPQSNHVVSPAIASPVMSNDLRAVSSRNPRLAAIRSNALDAVQSNHQRLSAVMSNNLESIKSAAPIQAIRSAQQVTRAIGKHDNVHVVDATEIIEAPTLMTTLKTACHYSTMLVALPYATTFGGELAVESIISALYVAHAKKEGQVWSTSLAGNWGSMLGLLNIITRPFGGYVSDLLYQRFKTPHVKKIWLLVCGFLEGVFLLYIGLDKNISMGGLIASVAIMCVFMEMGNGANFSLVPHINPHHTGIVAGTTGSFGNIGGILFSLAFRFGLNAQKAIDYQSALWHIGVAVMGVNLLCAAIPFGPTLER